MRLTLRRLLAYLDDILDPSDQEAIRKKIDESEFATDLLHRTRDAMRRLRLGAPAVMGGDGGLDPNTVAEYLDHTLPQEQVEDFERFCLESDIHLAEAGSCHQILTMVLGEPAEFEPDTRGRMYSISDSEEPQEERRVEPPHVVAGAPPEWESPPVESTRKGVPDYLRPTFVQRHRGKLAAIAVIVIGITAYFLWPSDVTPVPREFADSGDLKTLVPPEIDGVDDSTDASQDSADEDVTSGGFDTTADSDAPPFVPGGPAESSAPPTSGTEQGDSSAGDTRSDSVDPESNRVSPPPLEDPIGVSSDRATETADSMPAVSIPDADPSDASRSDKPIPTDTGATAPGLPTGLPATGSDLTDATDRPAPDGPPAELGGAAATAVPAGSEATPAPAPPDGPSNAGPVPAAPEPNPTKREPVATYSQDEDILLRYDSEQESWIRLPDNSELYDGDMLLAVPACRPTISLLSGVQVRLDGGSRMLVLGSNDSAGEDSSEATTGIELVYGRAVLRSLLPGPTIWLLIDEEHATVHFPGVAELAVEVHRTLPAGANPLSTSADVTADYYAASGGLVYRGELSQFEVTPHSSWHLTADGMTQPAPFGDRGVPKWIEGTMASPIEKARAIPGLSSALVAGERVELHLSELIDHPHEEIRRLAGRTSVHVGQFEPFVRALNDSDQRAAWPKYIPALKTALAAGPAVAEQVQTAFRRQKGDEGDVLFRMLWGYSNIEIDKILLRELIHRLDHESLDFRVLAIHNLKGITGKTLGYQPEYGREPRKRYIKKWKNRLDQNELLPVDESKSADSGN